MTTTKATVARWFVGIATIGWIAAVPLLLASTIMTGFGQDEEHPDPAVSDRGNVLGVTLFAVAVGVPVVATLVAAWGGLHRTAGVYLIFAIIVAVLLCPALGHSLRGL